ncbi:hypothetical protein KP79_PYT24969 [Mizuhopecten yessoensis]|uniref:Uncharacterized protein n=1 Tax=Mizuhopecten yessoensis TaxID=6573 RepID=A0A210Q1U0_MIZYE|nr:hypothetical protein KP79_PYT24969 [Mizuhopecten yessoensis]
MALFDLDRKPYSVTCAVDGRTVFPISNWCVFNTAVRTNNDVEGWHHRLNTRVNVRGPVPFYLLIQQLFREAEAIPMQLKMVTEGKLKRHQRKRS